MQYLKKYLNALKKLDEAFFLSGADLHKYSLHLALTEKQVSDMETKYTSFPYHYRTFLLELGNGGAGPAYGVYTLEKSLHTVRNNNWSLSQPNRLTLDSYYLVGGLTSQEELKWMFDGCLPIADSDCGSIFLLVLSGKKSQQVWKYNHSKGELHKDSENFLEWYEKWLSTCLIAGAVAEIKNHFMAYGEVDTICDEYTTIRLYFEKTFNDFSNVWMLNLLLPVGDIHAYEALGWLYLCDDHRDKASHYFHKMYASHEEKIKAAGAHGLWALYMLEGNVRKALKIGEVALALSKFCEHQARIYELQYSLSLTYAVVGQKIPALKAAESLIEIFPIIDVSFEILAALHVKFKDKRLAKDSITRLISNNPVQKSHYARKLWHIYKQIGAEEWSFWIAQLIGCRDEKKMLQRMQGKREELRRTLQNKYQKISGFFYEQIEKVNYVDELDHLINLVNENDTLEDFEIHLLQYTNCTSEKTS
ncbi:SMI1/KNR4 family protein [Candidatus Uabimicrobium sp. HlEnr_7]|uniref:SMI1/KNR4 family protein n=1 Tax=Candidatus Uabimicrobium helgolandensis TaxID=3095367 RepID=UPI003555EE18